MQNEKQLNRKNFYAQIFLFILIGMLGTAVHTALNLIGIKLFSDASYLVIYVLNNLSFFIGTIFVYLLNTRLTYKKKPSIKKFFQTFVVYIPKIALLQLFLLFLLTVSSKDFTNSFGPLIFNVITIPVIFLWSRYIANK